MKLTIATFNLNNLFSRFNFGFQAEVPDLEEGDVALKRVQKLVSSIDARLVEYEGIAVTRKDPDDRAAIIRRIQQMNADVLALQEVEDIDTLRYFASRELSSGQAPLYPYLTLIEGNDLRLIDLALLSKYPLGAVTTWQHAVHPDDPDQRVFSRDLLQVEILSKNRDRRLCTVFNNHLKSHFVPFPEDQVAGTKAANKRRQQQAEIAAKIIASEMSADDRFVVLGDMTDGIDSPYIKPLTDSPRMKLINGLKNPEETRPTPKNQWPPTTTAWTYRFKESGKPPRYDLYDQIWLSPALAQRQTGAFIDRRTKLGGDGSDHDPAWIEVEV